MDEEQKNNLLKEFGIEELPEETQNKVIVAMTETLIKKLTLRILEELPEDDMEEFEKIQDSGDNEKVEQFLREKLLNYDALVEEVSVEFKKDIKGHIENLKASMNIQ